MIPTFVDTSYFIALAAPHDPLHVGAVMWRYALRGPFITTEFVLLEVVDGFSSRRLRGVAQTIIDRVRSDSGIEIIPADSGWLERGYQLFCQRSDKDWGLTDRISFKVMRDFGLHEALTHDIHFEQAGFKALLRTDPPE